MASEVIQGRFPKKKVFYTFERFVIFESVLWRHYDLKIVDLHSLRGHSRPFSEKVDLTFLTGLDYLKVFCDLTMTSKLLIFMTSKVIRGRFPKR